MPKGIVYLYRTYISLLTLLSLLLPPMFSPCRISKIFSFPLVIRNWASSLQIRRMRETCLLRSHLPYTFNSRLVTAKSQSFQPSCFHTSILGFLLLLILKNGCFPSSKMGDRTTSLCKRAQALLFCPGYQKLPAKGDELETLKMYPVNPVINLYFFS